MSNMNPLSLGIASRGIGEQFEEPCVLQHVGTSGWVGYGKRSDGVGRQWGPHLWGSPIVTCLARALLTPARAVACARTGFPHALRFG